MRKENIYKALKIGMLITVTGVVMGIYTGPACQSADAQQPPQCGCLIKHELTTMTPYEKRVEISGTVSICIATAWEITIKYLDANHNVLKEDIQTPGPAKSITYQSTGPSQVLIDGSISVDPRPVNFGNCRHGPATIIIWHSKNPFPLPITKEACGDSCFGPKSVPTMTEWGLIALGLLLAGSLAFMIRRRFTVRPVGA